MTHKKIATIIILIGTAFLIVSCQRLYKLVGLTDDQTAAQVAKDQQVTLQLLDVGREQVWQIATAAVTAIGAILSGLLARSLNTEKKITTALITGIETATDNSVKQAVQAKATAAGVETQLHARVVELT